MILDQQKKEDINEIQISQLILGASALIHKTLGPGLLPEVYKTCLEHELKKWDLRIIKEKPIVIFYDNIKFDVGYKVDFLINDKVIVVIKTVDSLTEQDKKQLETYIRLSPYKLGLMINFNADTIKKGTLKYKKSET